MSTQELLSITNDTQSFFYSTLEDAVKNKKLFLSQPLLKYLSSILAHYSLSKNLCQEDSLHSALAKKYKKALSFKDLQQKILLKQVAEEILYTLGFFTPFLKKKIIGVGFYVNLGTYSYKRLSSVEKSEEKKDIFLYCSENFLAFLDLFHYISKNCLHISAHVNNSKSL
ncbi:MAG: hypothetical protein HAW60_00250 [Bdellovibrionales bacterium]|nr:hypothetical protein [Bdellovibrionales bacterium]